MIHPSTLPIQPTVLVDQAASVPQTARDRVARVCAPGVPEISASAETSASVPKTAARTVLKLHKTVAHLQMYTILCTFIVHVCIIK